MAAHYDKFHCVVLLPENLPHHWKEIFNIESSQRAWLHLGYVGHHDDNTKVSNAILSKIVETPRLFAFRLDDDDALSTNFIDKVRLEATRTPDRTVLSFDRGFYFRTIGRSRVIFKERDKKNIALGLGIFSAKKAIIGPYQVGHHQKPNFPVINFNDQPYWIRTIHSTNDSGVRVGFPWSIGIRRKSAAHTLGHSFPRVDMSTVLERL